MTGFDVHQHFREEVKKRRRNVERAKASLEESDPTDEDWGSYHSNLHVTVMTWVMSVHPLLEEAASEGEQPYQELWQVREIGEYTGLGEVFDDLSALSPNGDPLPIGTLEETAAVLEAACIPAFDLPEQPPVVDEPWSPEEIRSPEEMMEDVDGDLYD